MSTAEHAFTNAFYREFSKNGETGIPNVFAKTDIPEGQSGPSITWEEFEEAERVLQASGVEVGMQLLDYSPEGARALFKTAFEIPQEVLDLLEDRNHLGRIGLTDHLH